MALVLKNDAVFLHIPKTGGKWVTSVLEEMDLVRQKIAPRQKHLDIDHFFAYRSCQCWNRMTGAFRRGNGSGSRKKDGFMFCFVRHPLSWYESWFRYMSQPSRNWQNWGDQCDPGNWHPNAILNGTGSSDFNRFIENVLHRRPGYVTELFGWYTKPPMNFIGKQENLVDDLIEVLDLMNIDYDEDFIRNYKKIGVSPDPANKIIWNEKLKQEIERVEYAGMVRYGYENSTVQQKKAS